MLTINGAAGEGGGQIVRTALALAAVRGQVIRIENIRAGRKNPGLAAQHLTAVRAAAMICDAVVSGDTLGATTLTFRPQSPPLAGLYAFNVAAAREGGSAGAASLVLQTILPPLAQAEGNSIVTVRGGTHVPWSPSYHYLANVYLPQVNQLGLVAQAELLAWGWHPAGEGEIRLEIAGASSTSTVLPADTWAERGKLKRVSGTAVAASLPSHIAQRMCDRATSLLTQAGIPSLIDPQRVRSVSPGAGIFLTAEYERGQAGFSALGRKGKASEVVAEEAVTALLAFHRSGAAVDAHLTDQLLLPAALAGYSGSISTERVTQHSRTNLAVIAQFLGPVGRVDVAQNMVHLESKRNQVT